ncbi:MAG: hypothetical protein CMJ24_11330 [Phycisphaerae bacterium]|nr:hypothetical protein [Phycisphaerae bacterium]|tara:strand:+ start:1410 stop:2927 length:1518 start_codon:yes stop_codon:yes gene_type:complete
MNTDATRSRGTISSTTMVALATGGAMVVTIAWMLAGGSASEGQITETDLFTVERGGFEISIPSSGDLASLDIVEIRNRLEGTSTIMWLIPEGSTVEEGELLLRLDDETVNNNIEKEEELLTLSKNQLENAISNLEIAEKRRDTNVSQAQLKIDLAKLDLEAWQHGDVVSRRKTLQLNLETAEKDYSRLRLNYQKSIELKEKNFISQNELDQDEISMIRAKATWEQAVLAEEVYENYTYKKDKQIKESNLSMAEEEYTRIVRREEANVSGNKSNVEAFEEGYANRQDRLAKYQEQKGFCEVPAPAPGLVVYGSSVEDWRDDKPLRVGTKVSRNELLFILPDNANMSAELSVNEALSGYVENGQRVTVVPDAIPDVMLEGKVLLVGVLAQDGGWRDPNRRDYTVTVELEGEEGLSLKPSMRCRGRIYIDQVEDVVYVPVHAVGREGMQPYVWLRSGDGYIQHPVSIGDSSELYVEIEEGLEEGDLVLLREPEAGTITQRIEDISPAA